MKIYNSLTRKVEEIKAIKPKHLGIYTCGPTVYDYQHIGNFRTMILSDLLIRALKYSGYDLNSVRNITDIDDKTIKGAKAEGVELSVFTKKYTDAFFEDLAKLNVLPVDTDVVATEFVEEMIDYILELVNKKHAYVEDDGSVYFDISEFENYGKLSQIDKRTLKTGTRELSDEYTKDNAQDFALWKSVDKDEVGYESPWGRGRPGWHIECSVMSQKKLGDTFDIHVGGIDLLFPHHENEIAQSEAKTGKRFVNYFVHGEHLLVDAQKMSKSLKNFYKISDIEERGIEPLALRYLYLSAHYRDQLNFTWESLGAAQTALNKLRSNVSKLRDSSAPTRSRPQNDKVTSEFSQKFKDALNNDLNMPQALAVTWEVVKSDIASKDKLDLVLDFDQVLGLQLNEIKGSLGEPANVNEEVANLVKEREIVRGEGDYEKADDLRKKISEMGYDLVDTDSGTQIKPK